MCCAGMITWEYHITGNALRHNLVLIVFSQSFKSFTHFDRVNKHFFLNLNCRQFKRWTLLQRFTITHIILS